MSRSSVINLLDYRFMQNKTLECVISSIGFRDVFDLLSNKTIRKWIIYLEGIPRQEENISFECEWSRDALLTPKIRFDQLSLASNVFTGFMIFKNKKQMFLQGLVENVHDKTTRLRFLIPSLPKCSIHQPSSFEFSFYDNSSPSCPLGCIQHNVQSGETCFSISMMYSIKTEQLTSANEIDCDNLQIGQSLCIPGTSSYTVVSGDTCFSIASRFSITQDELQMSNPNVDCNNLQIGQSVVLVHTSLYSVASGDTCFSISSRFDITTDQLISANTGLNCDNLQIGQTLFIPQTTTIVVVSGTTCSSIATLFNVTVENILDSNPGLNCDTLQVGQVLYIPLSIVTALSRLVNMSLNRGMNKSLENL